MTADKFEGADDGSLIVVRDDHGYAGVVAGFAFKAGETLARFSAREVVSKPSYLTVQVEMDKHIVLFPEYLRYLNHSCDPNVFLNVDDGTIEALRPIVEGEPITFFYPSTEWEMDRPFDCLCGALNCLGKVAGASQLPLEVMQGYRLSGHIGKALTRPAMPSR